MAEHADNQLPMENFSFTYRWQISAFPAILPTTLPKTIVSPKFDFGVQTKFRSAWNLMLQSEPYPPHRENLYLSLHLVSCNIKGIEGYYKIAIINGFNPERVIAPERKFTVSTPGMICLKVVNRSEIVRENSPYIRDNTLEILCQIRINPIIPEPENTIAESQSFKIFWKYIEDKKFTDATIKVDEKIFHVHKMVLAARSPVFAAMFDHDLTEANLNCVEILDFESNTFEDFLAFVYKGELNRAGNLLDLMSFADKYNVESLRMKCELALERQLSVENAPEVLFRADLHDAKGLKKKAMDFIKFNIREIYNTEAWHSMSSELKSEVICSLGDSIQLLKTGWAPYPKFS